MATTRLCSIPGCGKPTKQNGWCNSHYLRWRRHGDPLAGRVHEGEALKFFREVVLKYRGDDCLLWPFARSCGYGYLRIGGRAQRVPRLVCEHIYGVAPTSKHEAAHSCGKGHEGCCAISHLSWKTPVENQADKIDHGTILRGVSVGNAKLTETEVKEILTLKGKLFQREIAALFGISTSMVSAIHRRDRWGWLAVSPS